MNKNKQNKYNFQRCENIKQMNAVIRHSNIYKTSAINKKVIPGDLHFAVSIIFVQFDSQGRVWFGTD